MRIFFTPLLFLFFNSCVSENTELNSFETQLTGKELYAKYCASCHMENGEGIAGFYPPLKNSDYMLNDINRTIKTVLYGSNTPIIVNELSYPGYIMTRFDHLSDDDIASITTYILNAWGNNGGNVTSQMVTKNR